MSRGGRGGRGGGGAGVRAIADALGIQRQDLASYGTSLNSKEPPPLFPTLNRKPLPLEQTADLQYLADVQQELLHRFHESPFYLQPVDPNQDIKRYTDKYRTVERETWQPHWNRIPAELCWLRKSKKPLKTGESAMKKRKIDQSSDKPVIDSKLNKLLEEEEKKESVGGGGGESDGEQKEEQEEQEGQEEGTKRRVEEEGADDVISDEDALFEEDNDYIDNYFDPGDDYADNDDDGLEDDQGVYS